MKFARVVAAIAVATAVLTLPSYSQGGPFDKIKKKVQEKTDAAVDKAADKEKPKEEPAAAEGQQGSKAVGGAAASDQLKPGEGAWANYDFKPGDRVLFADD